MNLSIKSIIAIVAVGSLLLFALFFAKWWVGVSNDEIGLRVKSDAQENTVTLFADNMWKTLQTEAKITDKSKDAFKEIYIPMIEGRYSKGDGTLMKWIVEQNPVFDQSLYTKLMNSVEAMRSRFFIEQDKLVSIKQEHQNLRLMFPSSMVVGDRPEIKLNLITSAVTKEMRRTGEENDVDIFK